MNNENNTEMGLELEGNNEVHEGVMGVEEVINNNEGTAQPVEFNLDDIAVPTQQETTGVLEIAGLVNEETKLGNNPITAQIEAFDWKQKLSNLNQMQSYTENTEVHAIFEDIDAIQMNISELLVTQKQEKITEYMGKHIIPTSFTNYRRYMVQPAPIATANIPTDRDLDKNEPVMFGATMEEGPIMFMFSNSAVSQWKGTAEDTTIETHISQKLMEIRMYPNEFFRPLFIHTNYVTGVKVELGFIVTPEVVPEVFEINTNGPSTITPHYSGTIDKMGIDIDLLNNYISQLEQNLGKIALAERITNIRA